MTFMTVNYLAVALAALAAFVFGAVWYGVLGKVWLNALGRSPGTMKRGAPPPLTLITTLLAELVMAWVLARVINAPTIVVALETGFLIWLGFVITTLLVNHAYQGSKRSLTVIDGAHWLGVLLIQGAILGALG